MGMVDGLPNGDRRGARSAAEATVGIYLAHQQIWSSSFEFGEWCLSCGNRKAAQCLQIRMPQSYMFLTRYLESLFYTLFVHNSPRIIASLRSLLRYHCIPLAPTPTLS